MARYEEPSKTARKASGDNHELHETHENQALSPHEVLEAEYGLATEPTEPPPLPEGWGTCTNCDPGIPTPMPVYPDESLWLEMISVSTSPAYANLRLHGTVPDMTYEATMRKKAWLATLLFAGFVLILIRAFSPQHPGPTPTPIAGTSATPTAAIRNGGSSSTVSTQGKLQPQTDGTTYPRTSPATAADASSSFQEWVRDVQPPIEFYGKVIDQDNQPVAGATVEFTWTHLYPEADFKTNTVSDANGMFSVTDVNGSGLNIHVSKPGYSTERSLNQSNFRYVRLPNSEPPFQPDRLNPVIFHLRKKGPGTDLITAQFGARQKLGVSAPLNGEPVWVDLLERKSGQRGQLQISQIKPEFRGVSEAREWVFRMSIPSGGFVEQNDEFPFQAPESGYSPVVEFHFVKGGSDWATHLRKRYYIAFGQPRLYGWLTLETQIGMEGARLQYAINPHGSRYLEPKETQPPARQLPPGVTEVIPDYAK